MQEQTGIVHQAVPIEDDADPVQVVAWQHLVLGVWVGVRVGVRTVVGASGQMVFLCPVLGWWCRRRVVLTFGSSVAGFCCLGVPTGLRGLPCPWRGGRLC